MICIPCSPFFTERPILFQPENDWHIVAAPADCIIIRIQLLKEYLGMRLCMVRYSIHCCDVRKDLTPSSSIWLISAIFCLVCSFTVWIFLPGCHFHIILHFTSSEIRGICLFNLIISHHFVYLPFSHMYTMSHLISSVLHLYFTRVCDFQCLGVNEIGV